MAFRLIAASSSAPSLDLRKHGTVRSYGRCFSSMRFTGHSPDASQIPAAVALNTRPSLSLGQQVNHVGSVPETKQAQPRHVAAVMGKWQSGRGQWITLGQAWVIPCSGAGSSPASQWHIHASMQFPCLPHSLPTSINGNTIPLTPGSWAQRHRWPMSRAPWRPAAAPA